MGLLQLSKKIKIRNGELLKLLSFFAVLIGEVIYMSNQFVCKSCKGNTYTQGTVNHGYALIRPINKMFSSGSSLTYTFCKDCGEVSSIKVDKPHKF